MELGSIDSNPTAGHVSLTVPPSQNARPVSSPRTQVGETPGVLVQNARKAYGNRPPILNNYNMTVPKGTIYGLLGASGCGKTTILSCIVGLRKLDEGDILVCGARPGTRESGIPGRRIGYMPQDIALYDQFTIKEILQYYGRIYGLTQDEITKRMEYLIEFLDLPGADRIIGSLSGGQQRRTSLAVSLAHQPELLILDEPTVGVDPLVRERIWEHLCSMVKTKKTTIIVTTHYIEEARQAHTVGLMRNGRLLIEKAPNALLEEHNCELLEDIVLKLCKKDNLGLIPEGTPSDEVSQALSDMSFYTGRKNLSNKPPDTSITGDKSPIVGIKFKRRYTEENMAARRASITGRRASVVEIVEIANDDIRSRMDRVRALILRNYITFFRNMLFVVAVLLIPSIQIIISNFVIGYEPKYLAFGLLNREVPQSNGSDICPYQSGCLAEGLSCKYVDTLPKDSINLMRVYSEEEAVEEIQAGRLWGYMSVPENYSQHMGDRALSRNYATNETIDGTTISFRMDMSHSLGAALLQKLFYENLQTFVKAVAGDCDQDIRSAEIPLKITPIYGSLETGYQEFIVPAMLLLVLFFVPLASGGIAYIQDKKKGTLDRSRVAGVTTFDVLLAFMVTEGSVIIFQTLISLFLLIVCFGLVVQGSTTLFMLICLLTGIAGLSLGFLIAMMVDEEMEAVIIALGMYAPIMILSGIIWPLEGVNAIVLAISYSLPCTWPTEAVRAIVNRGWGFTHSKVWPGFAVLVGWTISCWILTTVVHKIRNR